MAPETRPALPTVDVVVSAFNEVRYIERCLTAVAAQDYPAQLVQVWLIDGGSTDGTIGALHRFAAGRAGWHVVADGSRLNLPEALNLARHLGCADLVAKVDAHGYPAVDYLSSAAAAFRQGGPAVGCVGGLPTQVGETPFGNALAAARGSRFGIGGGTYARAASASPVASVQCGVYRRSVLDEVGWFDPTMQFGEDEEVNWRITEAGYQILLAPSMSFTYFTRPTWRGAYRQYRNYGDARIRVVRRHATFLRPYHLAPAAFLVALAGSFPLLRVPLARRLVAALLGGYSLGAAGAARAATRNRPGVEPLRVVAAFAALHAGYGVGMLVGLGRWARSSLSSARRSSADRPARRPEPVSVPA